MVALGRKIAAHPVLIPLYLVEYGSNRPEETFTLVYEAHTVRSP